MNSPGLNLFHLNVKICTEVTQNEIKCVNVNGERIWDTKIIKKIVEEKLKEKFKRKEINEKWMEKYNIKYEDMKEEITDKK